MHFTSNISYLALQWTLPSDSNRIVTFSTLINLLMPDKHPRRVNTATSSLFNFRNKHFSFPDSFKTSDTHTHTHSIHSKQWISDTLYPFHFPPLSTEVKCNISRTCNPHWLIVHFYWHSLQYSHINTTHIRLFPVKTCKKPFKKTIYLFFCVRRRHKTEQTFSFG